MAALEIESVVVNDKGRVRKNNEDNYYLNGVYMKRDEMDRGAFSSAVSQDSTQLYAVCDGIGGSDAGEEASLQAVMELAEWQKEGLEVVHPMDTTPVLREISRNIWKEAVGKGKDSGTTLAMLVINGQWFYCANVGDSRVYLLRGGEMTRLSLDHSRVQRMLSMGMLTPEEAKTYPGRHVIDQYMGMPGDIKISPYYSDKMELKTGDLFLICSDGLTDMVEDSEILEILEKASDLQQAGGDLLKAAYGKGGRDNITIILARVRKAAHIRQKGEAGNKALSVLLLVLQVIVSGFLLLSVIDFVYYLLH